MLVFICRLREVEVVVDSWYDSSVEFLHLLELYKPTTCDEYIISSLLVVPVLTNVSSSLAYLGTLEHGHRVVRQDTTSNWI